VVLYTAFGLITFYGGSTYASLVNQRFADFFVEKVPLGDRIYDAVEDTSLAQSVKRANVDNVPSKAIEAASAGYERLNDAVTRVISQSKDAATEAKEKAKELNDNDTVQQVKKSAKDMVKRVERKVEKSGVIEKGQEELEKAKVESEKLIQKAKDAAGKAEAEIRSKATSVRNQAETQWANIGKDRLPLQHEPTQNTKGAAPYRSRDVHASASDEVRLRDPPNLPKLPKLAPTLSSLSGSEPMIAQLASTIDELAAFLREAPTQTGIKASSVLDDAKADLSKLYDRLEAVKRQEAAKLEDGLEQQKSRYDQALKKAADDAQAKVGKVDEAWKKRQEQERKREADEYAAKLKAELETQSQIINERLREEVVQQGIEMQRRWMKEIKQRVEAERGGRLAKLDELAKDLDSIQKISLDNSQALEESATALALSAALRELKHVALDEAQDANVKRPFSKELKRVKGALKTSNGQDDLLKLALGQLEDAKPEEGVETYSTLYAWFSQKVRPAVQRVALVPEQAGVLSHLMSAAIAPLLFTKSGYPTDGEDVPSVLARTQFHLERRDLDAAARELNQLKGWPKILAEDWLSAARRRLEIEQHLDMANAEAHYASLQNA
jgi:mitofilin